MTTPLAQLSPKARLILEVVGCVLIIVAALVPRMRDFGAGFDRGLEGRYGSFFALSAVNYERLGVGRFNSYPALNIEELEAGELAASSVSLFANHPPAVPLASWLAAKWMGPSGWNEAWVNGEAPESLEPVLRFPFLVAHLASLVLFYLAVRCASGSKRAMIALAVLAATPISILHATLIGAANPALAFLLAAALFHVRFLQSGRRSDLIGFGLSALFGGATALAHWFFLPGFLIQAFLRDKARSIALATSAAIGLMIPLAMHAVMSERALEQIGVTPAPLFERLCEMMAPLSDGNPLGTPWAGSPFERSLELLSEPVFAVGFLGVLLALAFAFRSNAPKASNHSSPTVELTLPLVFGALLLLFVTRRVPGDDGVRADLLVSALLFAAPGIAAAVALVFDSLSRPLAKLRGGIAPLVVAVSLVALPGLERANALRHPLRDPGPHDDPSLTTGPSGPLPSTTGRELASLIPADDVAIYPSALSLTAAHRYYAWRTLLPVDPRDAASITRAKAALELRPRTAWLLLPRSAEEQLGALSEALFAEVSADHPDMDRHAPDRQSESWRVWRLPSE